jgi:AraC-like DNA-binding protein
MTAVYLERDPVPALRGAVSCVWTQRISATTHLQRVVPDGCVDLIWFHGALQLVGPDTTARVVPLRTGDVAGIRLRPGAARLLLGDIPTSELRDLQVDVTQLWGNAYQPVVDDLAGAPSLKHATETLERTLLAHRPGYAADPAVDAVIAALQRPDPPAVPTLADSVGLSARQLRRRVTTEVGYGPQTLESVLRFDRARRLAPTGSVPGGLADLAVTAGYADQAHLTREVRRFAGTTPRELFGLQPHQRP